MPHLRSPIPLPGRAFRLSRRCLPALIALPLLARGAKAAGDGSLAGVVERGRLRVLNGPTMAVPAEARGAGRRVHDSFNAAIAQRLAEELGVGCDLVVMPPTGTLPALIRGEGDVALPALLSPRNASRVLLAQPHAIMDAVILSASPRRLRGPESLAGLRVGLLASHAQAFGDDAGIPAAALVSRVPDLSAMEDALLAEEVEAALLPTPQARALAARNPGAGLSPRFTLRTFTYAPALRFGAHDLLRAINASLAEMLHDGELAALFRRETGLPLPPMAPL